MVLINCNNMMQQFGSRFVFLQAGLLDINSLDAVLKKVSSVNSRQGPVFQLVSIAPLVSEKQVLVAVEQTSSAFDSGTAISSTLEFEFLLRLAGRRQIKDALAVLSLKEGVAKEAVLVGVGSSKSLLQKKAQNLGHALGLRPQKGLFESNFRKNKSLVLKSYAISPQQLSSFGNADEKAAIESLVLEKIALVALEE
jgi:tRNA threonylcarbamoyladenosine modification (KEOPS) complex Cgi121 subunit